MNARAELPLHAPGTQTDKGYIGQSVPRPNAKRLLQGRGAYVDDLRFPRLAHVVFFRNPYAHAKLKRLDLTKGARQPGVIACFDGRAVAEYCTPWVGVLGHLKGIKSAEQHAVAIERFALGFLWFIARRVERQPYTVLTSQQADGRRAGFPTTSAREIGAPRHNTPSELRSPPTSVDAASSSTRAMATYSGA